MKLDKNSPRDDNFEAKIDVSKQKVAVNSTGRTARTLALSGMGALLGGPVGFGVATAGAYALEHFTK